MTQHVLRSKALFVALIALAAVAVSIVRLPAAQTVAEVVTPKYDGTGALQLPSTYQRWVFVGSSLGLSYSEGITRGAEMFHETLMEPTAYEYYVRTGEFREGTMLALLLHSTQDGVLPGRQGRFAGPLAAVEMAVKDKGHRPEGWAYYNFGGANGLRTTAQAMPQASCYNCHKQNAKYDNVFLQFYSLLAATRSPAPATAQSEGPQSDRLALRGLDPVLLVDGREERGKAEIIADYNGHRYQFVSEPNRQRFVADPASFSIQNKMCLVVPDAPIDPSLFAVHDKRVYAFATPDCIKAFKADPKAYLPK
jgi:YHS domain-containing protein